MPIIVAKPGEAHPLNKSGKPRRWPASGGEIGNRFGRLEIIGFAGEDKSRNPVVTVRCDCGKEKLIRLGDLTAKRTTSCGCWNSDVLVMRNLSHGEAGSKIYDVWTAIKQRCHNPKNKQYRNYGARGIRLCDRWHTFQNFVKDLGEKPSDLHSLDRIDNDRGYEPGSVRWATAEEQTRNTRQNKRFLIDGDRLCQSDAAKRIGVDPSLVYRKSRMAVERGLMDFAIRGFKINII